MTMSVNLYISRWYMQRKVKQVGSKENVYRLQGLSCMNCAAKFEKNIRDIDSVEDVQVNFGASKVMVQGEVSVEQLEIAGAFDGIKVYPERERQIEKKESFWKKRENITTMISVFFIIIGYIFYFKLGEKNPITIGRFVLAISYGSHM